MYLLLRYCFYLKILTLERQQLELSACVFHFKCAYMYYMLSYIKHHSITNCKCLKNCLVLRSKVHWHESDLPGAMPVIFASFENEPVRRCSLQLAISPIKIQTQKYLTPNFQQKYCSVSTCCHPNPKFTKHLLKTCVVGPRLLVGLNG